LSWEKRKERLGKKVLEKLFNFGMIKTWYRDKPEGWTLVSGLWSPFYIQLRPLCSVERAREVLMLIGRSLGEVIRREAPDVNKIVGVAMAGIPIAIAVTMETGIPSCYTRKLPGIRNVELLEKYVKEYGEHRMVEGLLNDGDRVAVVDDLVTRFDSKLVALRQIEWEAKRRGISVECKHVVVLLDREQGAEERARKVGIKLHALIPFKSKGIEWLKNCLTEIEYEIIKDYLSNPSKYQEESIQRHLRKIALEASVGSSHGTGR